MDQLRQDLRQSIRILRATPAITAMAIVTLAIGVGANATIFSAVSALVLRPLPIPDADRVVFGVSLREGFDPFGTSLLDYAVFKGAVPEFASTGVEVRPGDPRTFAAAAGIVVFVSLLACYLPARKAAGVDPALALRD